MKKFVLIALWLLFTYSFLNAQNYLITDFGAKTDVDFINTDAINEAIKTCSENAGGKVIVPAGIFISGTIVLQSNVNLNLMAGAVIKASSNLEDFRSSNLTNTENIQTRGIIISNDANNISISGDGMIDCSSDEYKIPGELHNPGDLNVLFTRQGKDYLNPKFGTDDGPVKMKKRPGYMIHLSNGNNISITGIKIINSPHWTMRLADSKNITIHNVKIMTDPLVPNSDGIHFTCCQEVRVSDCNFSCGDDAICFTTFGDHNLPTQNIVVSNCVFQSRSSGIRIGPGTGEIKNLAFNNIIIKDSNRGIGIFARDNPAISNISFSNIIIETKLHTGHWWGNGEPIHISSVKRNRNTIVGKIDNISFNNMKMKSDAGILVYGDENDNISNISFNRISLNLVNSKLNEGYGGNFDLRPAYKNELSIFNHDIAGIFAKDVSGLDIDFSDITFADNLPEYFVGAIQIEDCKKVNIRNNSFINCKEFILPSDNNFNVSGNSKY